jgi:low temperature requirement protein LtrA
VILRRPKAAAPVGTDESHRVTTLELFFDLVFVFAATQITGLMADDLTWQGLARGVVIAAIMWWAWVGFSWLGNIARADEGVIRTTLLVSMGSLFIVGLTIPEAFDDLPGGLDAPVVLAVALAVPRLAQVWGLWRSAEGDDALRATITRFALVVAAAQALLVVGALVGPPLLTVIWLVALVIDYGGTLLIAPSGWRLPSAGHFAERHGLIIIVILGESIVAVGVGVADLPISLPIIITALLSIGITMALWWIYFDVTAIAAERRLAKTVDAERTGIARDAYSYLHFPMLLGVLVLAIGLKKANEYVGDTAAHTLTDPLPTLAGLALFVGPAMFLTAQVAFRWRVVHTFGRPRPVAAGALVVASPLALWLPAAASVAVVALVLASLVAFERRHYAELRHRVRHAPH